MPTDKERAAAFDMEWGIIKDKLAQGVNGVEWLVLNDNPRDHVKKALGDWFGILKAYGITEMNDAERVMQDALIMDSETYYKTHEFNWWVAVRYTLTYLHLLKKYNYDRYFNFMQSLEKKINQGGGSH
ncbi:hypothetical protein [Paenibacillus senegalensis]|uniref:hypothetical protein n=1 Tax=Paenibacillus senegalensis TaxID=1465766 RepID=UPI000288ABD4|nr:hypothetical protein [Paenibacillus senegalensis]